MARQGRGTLFAPRECLGHFAVRVALKDRPKRSLRCPIVDDRIPKTQKAVASFRVRGGIAIPKMKAAAKRGTKLTIRGP
jgi:hypothetical protein